MKLLLDTHILLWACAAPDSLPAAAADLIENRDNELFSALQVSGRWVSRTLWGKLIFGLTQQFLEEPYSTRATKSYQ